MKGALAPAGISKLLLATQEMCTINNWYSTNWTSLSVRTDRPAQIDNWIETNWHWSPIYVPIPLLSHNCSICILKHWKIILRLPLFNKLFWMNHTWRWTKLKSTSFIYLCFPTTAIKVQSTNVCFFLFSFELLSHLFYIFFRFIFSQLNMILKLQKSCTQFVQHVILFVWYNYNDQIDKMFAFKWQVVYVRYFV